MKQADRNSVKKLDRDKCDMKVLLNDEKTGASNTKGIFIDTNEFLISPTINNVKILCLQSHYRVKKYKQDQHRTK